MPPSELEHIATSIKRFLPVAKIAVIVLAFAAYFRIAYHLIDPDLWWRIHSGMDILASGVLPFVDSWTWTVAGHRWIEHEWLIDTVFALGIANGGWFFLAITFGALALLPFAVWAKRARNFVELFLVSLTIYLMFPIIGVRPQIVTVTLFFLLYEILLKRDMKQPPSTRWTLGMAAFFCIWTNLHPGYIAGFALWGLWLLGGLWEDRRELRIDASRHIREFFAIGIAFLATFLNPYGYNMHLESIYTLASGPMHTYIAEWQSPFRYFEPLLPTLLGTAVFLLWKFRTQVLPRQVLILTFFLLAFFRASRMAPMFLITLLPLLFVTAEIARQEIKRIWAAYHPERETIRALLFASFVTGAFTIIQISTFAWQLGAITYPAPLVSFLETERRTYSNMRILHPYEWGGYIGIARNNPPVYIDGRMPHWMLSQDESLLMHSVGFEIGTVATQRAALKRVCAEGVIIKKPRELSYAALFPIYVTLGGGSETPRLDGNIHRLKAQGWQTVYEDDDAVFFVAPKDWFTRFPC